MLRAPAPPSGAAVRSAVAPALVAAVAIGYVGVDLTGALADEAPAALPPIVHGGLVLLQAVALVFRARAPLTVFGLAVALDLVILATSGGELGIGALAVIVAAYTGVRRGRPHRTSYVMIAVGAAATAVVGTAAMLAAGVPWPTALLATAARLVLLYALPAATAEYLLGRSRLAEALHAQQAAADRERLAAAERELRAERTALARELHDIAGHHLSGIIVSSQAAAALIRTDPDEARATLQTLQQSARTALADLRRTVGLLRSDDDPARGNEGGVTPPTVAAIPSLVDAARARGQEVTLRQTGAPQPLGALAETAAYRMVQESLANAARHATGAACVVEIDYREDAVEVTVSNAPADRGATRDGEAGYGIAGMRERADLVGARLVSGPRPDGGWLNRLTVPVARERSAL